MSVQHTPGPWREVSGYLGDEHEKCFGIAGADQPSGRTGPVVCLVSKARDVSTIDAANARLIAAAPELLEACQALLASHRPGAGQCCAAADLGIAAIAKATGASS